MFYLWYCFDDMIGQALNNPAIGNAGWVGFWCLTLLHLALLPFFAVNRDAIIEAAWDYQHRFKPEQLYPRAILAAHVLLAVAVAQSVFH